MFRNVQGALADGGKRVDADRCDDLENEKKDSAMKFAQQASLRTDIEESENLENMIEKVLKEKVKVADVAR
jgi:hypothetical protein